MIIDAIMPTFNRAHLVPVALDSALKARVPEGCEVRITVVDNNSADNTAEVAKQFAARGVTYLFEGKQGRHHALNTGIGNTSGNVVALFDDDERIDENWFEQIALAFSDETIDFISGPYRPDWPTEPPVWLPGRNYCQGVLGIIDHGDQRRRYGTPDFDEMPCGGNFAIRRTVLERCGPYAPQFMYAEDVYLYTQLKKIGAVGYYWPELVIYHLIQKKRLSKRYFRRWFYAEGRNRGKLAASAKPRRGILNGPPLHIWRRGMQCLGRSAVNRLRLRINDPDCFEADLDVIHFAGLLGGFNSHFVPEFYYDRS
jgi:glycosyltransferase involved in cell wall biosynthesis